MDRSHGYKVEDPLLNPFTNKIAIKFLEFYEKFVDTISSFGVIFLSVTIEKQVNCIAL